MTHHFDEFSKALAEKTVPRRETLRLLGAALAGALLGPLGARTARAAGDPCRTYCNWYPKALRARCLAACRECNGDTSRLCTGGSSFACCTGGTTCCSGYCVDLADDFDNCGACGDPCPYPRRYEDGACVDGQCFYSCIPGAAECYGICTSLADDPYNCGACGNVCSASAPYCSRGQCWDAPCGGANLYGDPNNCGTCGNVCGESTPYCSDGQCTDCVRPDRAICNGVCVNILFDSGNCGACGNVCYGDYYVCSSGVCVDPFSQFYPPPE